MKMRVWKPSEAEVIDTSSWGTWGKESSKFPWYYDDKETCYILEGEATVVDEDGNSITFLKGDMVAFESGLQCTWRITKEIKKRYLFG